MEKVQDTSEPPRAGLGRVAVVDRGANARRVLRVVRDLARSGQAAAGIAVHAPRDRLARFAREAEESIELEASADEALRAARADTAWLGPASLTQRAGFAETCARLGVVHVGPPAEALRRLAAPDALPELAAQLGVPTASLTGAEPRARLVEVAVARDREGVTRALGVGEASLRLAGVAVLTESPSPALLPAEDAAARELAVRVVDALGWEGIAAVQLLLDPRDRHLALVGIDAVVETAPAVEAVTGLDLVRLALRLAGGAPLLRDTPTARGHAFAARILAQDPEAGLALAPGRVELLRMPLGPGVRAAAAVEEGDVAPAASEGILATIVVQGADRAEAAGRLEQALADSDVLLSGSGSSKAWLSGLCARAEVRAGDAGVGLVDLLAASGDRLVQPRPEAALVAAAIDAYDAELDLERARFVAEARRGRPRVTVAHGRTVELRYAGQRHRIHVSQTARDVYAVGAGGAPAASVRVERLGRVERRLTWRGRRWRVLTATDGAREVVQVDGVPHALVREPAGVVPAPMPAVVLAIPVVPGQAVAAGEPVARLESMRAEVVVKAPAAGIVRDVLAAVNSRVSAGAPLVRIESGGGALPSSEGAATGAPAHEEEPPRPEQASARDRYLASLDELHSLALGFDVAPAEARRGSSRWGELAAAVPGDDPEVLRAEDAALRAFVDVQWVFARTRVPGQEIPPLESLWRYLYSIESRGAGLSPGFLAALRRALSHYGAPLDEPGSALELALLRTWKAHERAAEALGPVLSILERRLAAPEPAAAPVVPAARDLLDRLVEVAQGRDPALADLAREVRYRRFDQPALDRVRADVYFQAETDLELLPRVEGREREALLERLVECPQPLATLLVERISGAPDPVAPRLVEALLRRYYRFRPLGTAESLDADGVPCAFADYERGARRLRVLAGHALLKDADRAARRLARLADEAPGDRELVIEIYLWNEGAAGPAIYLVGQDAPAPDDALAETLRSALEKARFRRPVARATFVAATPGRGLGVQASQQHYSFRGGPEGFAEDPKYRGIHPMVFERMQLERLSKFELERLPSAEDVYLFRAVARENPNDERLLAVAEVRDLTPVRDATGRIVQLPTLERMLMEALAGMRVFQARRPPDQRLEWNRVLLTLWPPLRISREEFVRTLARAVPDAEGLGLEMLLIDAQVPDPETGELGRVVLRVLGGDASGLRTRWDPATDRQIEPLTAHQQQVVQLRRRGLTHPHEIVRMLAPPDDAAGQVPRGEFVEHDLDATGALVPVERAPGANVANVVVGVVASFTARHPEGMRRVVVLNDPAKELGAVAEPECRRIIAAIDLAERLGVPVEWFEVSAGAKISMTSGTENMDWVSRVLRRIVEFTDRGGEVNVVVCGITVGAQPYWNAEATMLMHTKGILVMVPGAAMVLTGKEALEYSGGVAAEDNEGIGGYERIMGPNGQAQHRAASVAEACAILMRHYEHAYVAPGERFARRAETADPGDRDVRTSPHGPEGGAGFETVGDIFSAEKNPDRKKPFDIRRVMAAAIDQDHPPLERWPDQRGGDTAVVWDAHLGGWPVCLIGIESRPIPRLQFAPADGPQVWSAGTLFPQSSKKIARAIHAASGSRPVVVLANLAGFDGSPESMRRLQLEYGAEIGRAVVRFRGPLVLVVVSRYHGAAFVVFAKTLREHVEIAAIEGARASVIGGGPAAGVVFAREVEARTRQDPRVEEAEAAAEAGGPARTRFAEVVAAVRAEKLGEVADEFDRVHSVERALKVGSIDRIIAAADLRPYLIDAIERGMARAHS